jgi:hypothetical protein
MSDAVPPLAPDPNRPIPSLQTVLADIPRQEQLAIHDRTTKQIALTVIVGFFMVAFAIIAIGLSEREISTAMVALLSSVMSIAIAGFGTVINFYFGSSASSVQKGVTINTALTKSMDEKAPA